MLFGLVWVMNVVVVVVLVIDSVVYSCLVVNDSGLVWLSIVVNICCWCLMVVEVVKVLVMLRVVNMMLIVMIWLGVVEMNYCWGCVGLVGECDFSGLVDGCVSLIVMFVRILFFG